LDKCSLKKREVPWEHSKLSEDDASIIKVAESLGIIDMACVREKIEMHKRKEILNSHKYKIWQGKDGKWYTYLPDDEKGRIKKKRNTQSELEKVIIQYYRDNDKERQTLEFQFSKCWRIWKECQESFGLSWNTLQKYDSDYQRFFANTDFEKMDIRNITEEDITTFMVQRISYLNLREKAGRALWCQITGVFKTARIRKKIVDDPCPYVETRRFNNLYYTEYKTAEERTLSKDEKERLLQQLQKDHEFNPLYMQPYAIELALYTGMRVGELSALKWKNVVFSKRVIYISESEKHDRTTNGYKISSTKTGKTRTFPLTEGTEKFFRNLQKLQIQNGILGEFVFSDMNGRINSHSISQCMRRRCKMANIKECGIHTIRRTVNSELRCNGVSVTVAASLLGHTEEVNRTNYTYDITGLDYKREMVKQAIG